MNQVVKIQVLFADKEDMKNIHELMWEQRRVMNDTITMAYEWSDLRSKYKETNGVYPKAEEILPNERTGEMYASLQGYIDAYLGTKYQLNMTSNRSSAIQKAMKKFNADYKEFLKGLKSIPSFRQSNNVVIHNNAIKLYKEENTYLFDIGLFSRKGTEILGLTNNRYVFKAKVKDAYQRAIVNRVIDGRYKLTESNLRYNKDNKKWFIYMGYSFEGLPEKKTGLSMGVKMGVRIAAYVAVHGTNLEFSIIGGEVEAFRKQVFARQWSQRKSLPTSNRHGHGRTMHLKNVCKIGDKVARFRDTANHRYARAIVNYAMKNGVCEIRLENLKNISRGKVFLKDWTFYDLQSKIENKAKPLGIKVVRMDPKYEVQACYSCGNISKDNILEGHKFKCQNCGIEMSTDSNAALNIANPKFGLVREDSK